MTSTYFLSDMWKENYRTWFFTYYTIFFPRERNDFSGSRQFPDSPETGFSID